MAMLNMIKNMIRQKSDFQEAANLVLSREDTFDNFLIEDVNDDLPEGTKDPMDNDNSIVQPEGEIPMPQNNTNNDDEDIMNMEINMSSDTPSNVIPSPPTTAGDQIETAPSPNGDIMNEPLEDESEKPMEDESDVPSNLLDEPINDDNGDEDIEDDMDKQTTSEEDKSIMDESLDDVEEESAKPVKNEPDDKDKEKEESVQNESVEFRIDLTDEELEEAGIHVIGSKNSAFTEEITIGDGNNTEKDETDSLDELGSEAPDSSNSVTDAVKDKVAEATADAGPEPDEASDISSGTEELGSDEKRAALAKKIANLQKQTADIQAELASGT